MFKVGDIVEITEESSATGMLDFVDGKGYEVECVCGSDIYVRNESGRRSWYHPEHFKLHTKKEEESRENVWKVGQTVYDVMFGKGEVVDVSEDVSRVYPILVQFGCIKRSYTLDGKYGTSNKNRSLFFSEPVVTGDTKPKFTPVLKKGDVVVAVDKDGCSEILHVREELERQVKNTEGTLFYKEAFDFYRLGEKINFK